MNIDINVTNLLQTGDYVKIIFNSQSYTSNGVVGCTLGNCTATQSGTTLTVIGVLTAVQVMSSALSLQIYGLISNANTMYTDRIPITV